MDPSCGDCLHFGSFFNKTEVLSQPSINFLSSRYITAISGQNCSQPLRGFKESDFIANYDGKTGVFMPASGDNSPSSYFISFPFAPCGIKDNPGVQSCNRGLDDLINDKTEYYPCSTSMSGVNVTFQYKCEGKESYITDKSNLIYLFDGSGAATNINESYSSIGFTGYNINIAKQNNAIWYPAFGSQRQLTAKYLGGSSETPISKMNISAGWKDLQYERNNFWKVYQSGESIPDLSPSGTYPDIPTCYGISALTIDANSYLFKNKRHPYPREYTFYNGNISCSGNRVMMSSFEDILSVPTSGAITPTTPSIPGEFVDFTVPEFKGTSLLNIYDMQKLGCSGICDTSFSPVFNTEYDKFFNMGKPTVKFHYNNRVEYTLSLVDSLPTPASGTLCGPPVSACSPVDLLNNGGSGFYAGGDWITVVLSDIGGNILESPEIEIQSPAFSGSASGVGYSAPSGTDFDCQCGMDGTEVLESTNCSIDLTNISESMKFKIQADFSGDTVWYLRILNIGSGSHPSLPFESAHTFQSFPAKYLIEMNGVLAGSCFGSGQYTASQDFFDQCTNGGEIAQWISGSKQTLVSSGNFEKNTTLIYGSGILEFDWT